MGAGLTFAAVPFTPGLHSCLGFRTRDQGRWVRGELGLCQVEKEEKMSKRSEDLGGKLMAWSFFGVYWTGILRAYFIQLLPSRRERLKNLPKVTARCWRSGGWSSELLIPCLLRGFHPSCLFIYLFLAPCLLLGMNFLGGLLESSHLAFGRRQVCFASDLAFEHYWVTSSSFQSGAAWIYLLAFENLFSLGSFPADWREAWG